MIVPVSFAQHCSSSDNHASGEWNVSKTICFLYKSASFPRFREYTGALSLLELLAIVKSYMQKKLMVFNMIPEPVDALNHSISEILNIQHLLSKPLILLMEEIRLTTWDVWNPVNNGINYISTGARFLPSTVLPLSSPILVSVFSPIKISGCSAFTHPAVLSKKTKRKSLG